MGIEINRRDNHFKLTGRALMRAPLRAAIFCASLYVDTAPMRGQIQDIEPDRRIHLAIEEARRTRSRRRQRAGSTAKPSNIKTKRGVIKPRTPNQAASNIANSTAAPPRCWR